MTSLTKWLLGAQLKTSFRDVPGGPVVKNSPANAGDTGLIAGSGRFHMLRANWLTKPVSHNYWACAWSPGATAAEPERLEPVPHNRRSHRNEKPTHRN